jgi:hypothetical protein
LRRLTDSWIAVAIVGAAFLALIAAAAHYALEHELGAGGQRAVSGPPSAGPSPSPSTVPSPSPSPVVLGGPGRPASSAEFAAMVQAGMGPAERDLGLGDWSSCTGAQACLRVRQASGLIGVDAGTLQADRACPAGCGEEGCLIFLFSDAIGWHYVNAGCASAAGSLPGPYDTVYVFGCANVRNRPGLESVILDCLRNGTRVDVDSAPAYVEGRLWWHLKGLGWMAHDFLVAPRAGAAA